MPFIRFPTDHGDTNVFGLYVLAQLEAALPMLTGRLANTAGALTFPAARIGIDNGTNKGIIQTSAETISLAACSNSTWLAIEAAVAGTTYTLTAADIAGATSAAALPASFKAAYDGLKGGFYLAGNKRLIGLAWMNAAGVLEGIINLGAGIDFWDGYNLSDDANDTEYYFKKEDGQVCDVRQSRQHWTAWNRAGAPTTKTFNWTPADLANIKKINAVSYNDTGTTIVPLTDATYFGHVSNISSTQISLTKQAGGGDFAACIATYGEVIVDYL